MESTFRKLLSLLLVMILCCSSLAFATTAGGLSQSEGTTDGTTFGMLDGERAGLKDYHNGLSSSWSRNYPKSETTVVNYRLGYDNSSYQNSFLAAYRIEYEIAYNRAYRSANTAQHLMLIESATEDGQTVGQPEGEAAASIDLIKDFSNDWKRAFNSFTKYESLSTRYNLDRESDDYELAFINGFTEAYKQAYTAHYQASNKEMELKNANYQMVSMFESTIVFDRFVSHTISGATTTESQNRAWLEFPLGSIYEDTYVGLHRKQNTFGDSKGSYEPVSHMYAVSVANTSGSMSLYQPVTLNFFYSGSERVGVYQWLNDRWVYVPTKIDFDSVSIELPTGNYKGGSYALFIDNSYKVPSDIAFSWARNDIITSIRRGHLAETSTFRPTSAMTKLEFADLLYRTMSYRVAKPNVTYTIADSDQLGSYKTAVEYVLATRFMFLDSNDKFNPNQLITYKDVEKVIGSMLLTNFSYNELASKMLYEKYARSPYLINKNGTIQRAEVIYALNEMIK